MITLEANTDGNQLQDFETIETRNNGNNTKCDTPAALERKPQYKNIMHLWEFLLELLADESCNSLIAWSRKTHGEFRLKNPQEVALRWGNVKHKQNMNYEKLGRALRHYYKQGIIKKVKGQRLVYKFHKLPYQYNPHEAPDNLRMLSTNSKSQGEYFFTKDLPSSTNENLDGESERPLTDREKIKKIFQERVKAKKNLNKSNHTEENDEVPSTTPSPQSSTTSPLPQVYPELIPTPTFPYVTCTSGGEIQVVNQPTCTCKFVYPVQVDRQQDPAFSSGLTDYGGRSVAVSVIKKVETSTGK